MLRWLLLLPLSACWLSQDVVDARKADLPRPGQDTDVDPPVETDDTTLPDETDETDTSPPAETDETAPEESDTPEPECDDYQLPPGTSTTELSATTEGADDDHVASCLGFTGGPDLVWSWVVPADGCYVISTLTSDFDTVLYLLDGCEDELVCNDDILKQTGNYESEVHAELTRDQSVSIVVDGYDATEAGNVVLSIWEGEHLPVDHVSHVASGTLYSGTTRGADDSVTFTGFGDCPQGSGGKDLLIEWTTPLAGYWHFWLEDPDFDAVLSLHRMCDTFAFVCDDVAPSLPGPGHSDVAEEVYMTLDEGETLVLRVAGHEGILGPIPSGSFELHAEALPEL